MNQTLLKNYWYKLIFILFIIFAQHLQAQTVSNFGASGTWVCPAGVTSVVVETWGGGGAGGGLTNLILGGGGGGGGGSYSKAVVDVVPGTSYNYIVGDGGIGSTGNGGDGGASSFNGATIANGGTGGGAGPSGAAGIGGIGINYNGGNGFAGTLATRSGGGGGGAGDAANGANAVNTTAGAGGAVGGGIGGNGRTNAGSSFPGNTIGGGGGGGYSTALTNRNGGFGARGQVRLSYCSSINTNSVLLTSVGPHNWASMPWSLGHVPNPCENVLITVDRSAAVGIETVTINMVGFTVQNFTLRNLSNTSREILVSTTSPSATFNINGNLVVEAAGLASSNRYNITTFGVGTGSTVNVYGNIVLGRIGTLTSATEGHASVSGNTSVWNLYGDMIFHPKGYTTNRGTIFNFNKAGTAFIVNNSRNNGIDTTRPVLFETLNIGTTNTTNVTMSGTNFDGYISRLVNGIINIGVNSTLDMPANYSLNLTGAAVGTPQLNMAAGSRLRLGGDRSLPDPDGTAFSAAGSNFPAGFNYNFNPTSTVEYYGSSGITQTIYNVPTYANLIASNPSGIGRAQKITTANVTANTSFNINNSADVTMGANITSVGPFNVNTNGGLYCGLNTVFGAGVFTLQNLGYLGLGSPQGITTVSNASGNVRSTVTRNFSTAGNYIYYNPSIPQVTGNGLPSTVNDITIDNPTTVTIATNLIVNGVDSLKRGTFDIGTTKISHDGANSRLNSIGGKMKANLGIVEMKGTSGSAQNISGSWFVNKTISTLVNANTTGIIVAPSPADTMLISSALLYGTNTNSNINTGNNLTLLSRDTATARFGEMVNSNSITGRVTVERWLPTTRKWRHLAWPTTSTQTAQQSWMENSTTANDNLKPGYGTIITDEQASWASGNFDSRSVSGPSVKYFDMALNKYVGIPNTRSYQMNTNSAYYAFTRGDRTCMPANGNLSTTILRTTGTLKTGDISITVPATRFMPIGNPYASAIDIRKLDTLNLTSTIYVWDPKLTGIFGIGAYQTLYRSGNDYRVMPGGGTYGALNSLVDTLESGQAFFVRARASAGTLTFKETAKNVGARALSFTGNNEPKEEAIFALLNLVVNGEKNLVDGTMATFDEFGNNDIDFDDALKLDNLSENVSIKTKGQSLSIDRRKPIADNDTLHLNLTGVRLASYAWDISSTHLKAEGRKAYLVDSYLKTEKQLSFDENNIVPFDITNAPPAYAANRFFIVFKQEKIAPLKFISLNANRKTDKAVMVDWQMENEKNVHTYTLQQSNDGRLFTDMYSQMPTANNGGKPSYNYNDAAATINENYYRVKATMVNAAVSFSNTVKVEGIVLNEKSGISIYPNPVKNGLININFTNKKPGNYSIKIKNSAGQMVYSEILSIQNNNQQKQIKLTNAAFGVYQLIINNTKNETETISMIVE